VWRCLAFANHDVVRTASRLNRGQTPPETIASTAMALLLSLRGTPCIYQGEELGLTEAEIPFEKLVDPYGIAFWPTFKGRDGCRTPMPWHDNSPHAGFTQQATEPWLPIPDEHVQQCVARQETTPKSQLQKTRALIELHQKHPALHSEEIRLVESPSDLLVFLCIFNLSEKTIDYELPQNWARSSQALAGSHASLSTDSPRSTYEPWSWMFLESQSSAG
jgi:alpha-glucosidase